MAVLPPEGCYLASKVEMLVFLTTNQIVSDDLKE